jgi:hypothetical protein
MTPTITIRRATPADADAIRRIAALDSGRAPEGDALLAESAGELRAVLPLAGGRALADPFEPTAEIVELLRIAARAEHRPEPRFRLRRPRSHRPAPHLRLA